MAEELAPDHPFRWNQFAGTYRGYHQSPQMTWKLKRTFYYPNKTEQSLPQESQRDIQPISYSNRKAGM